MKIFVTGGSGFVGGAVLSALAPRHQMIAMSRSEGSDAAVKALGAVPMRADLSDVDSRHLEGADAVIHAAAYVEEWGRWSDYEEANVRGTERLLAAARAAGVRRFVHVGTEAALFRGQHMRDIDETYPLAPDSPFPYSATKARAEAAVVAANDPASGFETIIIRPRLIWGEGDKTVLPVVKAMAQSGKFMWIDGGASLTSTTHIDNLVAALELALSRGKPGEAYFVIDGPPVEMRDFMTRYLSTAGVKLGDKSAPGAVIRAAANLIEPLWRLAGAKSAPPITRFTAHIMSRDCTISDAKARRDLGYRPVVTLEEGFARLAA